jgi:hypothetical protein
MNPFSSIYIHYSSCETEFWTICNFFSFVSRLGSSYSLISSFSSSMKLFSPLGSSYLLISSFSSSMKLFSPLGSSYSLISSFSDLIDWIPSQKRYFYLEISENTRESGPHLYLFYFFEVIYDHLISNYKPRAKLRRYKRLFFYFSYFKNWGLAMGAILTF